MQGIWDWIGQYAAIRECREIDYLGIAHGWAGILYATLRWHYSSSTALPLGFDLRLSQLAELAEPRGRGMRWKWTLRSQGMDPRYNYMRGWCNGSAGHVHLWTLAYDVLHEGRYLDLAEQVAWDAAEGPDTIGNLCCGGAGQAYALLNFYRHTEAKEWLDRACALASQAPHGVQAMSMMKDSLYKGEIGIAVLAADLAVPERASMPWFEAEGWPRL